MPGANPSRWCCQRLRLGMLATFLLATFGLALLGQVDSRAGTTPFSRQALASFPSNDKLLIAVHRADASDLRVELLGADGKLVAAAKELPTAKEFPAVTRFEAAVGKGDAEKLTVGFRFGKRRTDVPLRDILLQKAHETSLACGQEFFAGSTAALRLGVHGVRSVSETVALPGAEVVFRLRGADGKTQELHRAALKGDAPANIQVPIPNVPNGQYTLEVLTRSALGEEKLERQVRVKSEARILLVSDRPIYQPGHLIHLRALALRPFDLKPIEKADLRFEVEDAKGNKVFKRTLKTSEYGIASIDFQLADEVNMGAYQLRAFIGEQQAQKTVDVKRYVLPKFKVQVKTDKTFYLPKETVKVELQSDYFFGKPVAGGKVEVTAETFDVAFRKFHTWNGKTDENGHVKFDIQLPAYFVGQPLQQGNALVKFEVKLTDTADHTETVTKTANVSDQAIRVSLIPEGGRLVPAMDNRIFAAAVYPDGSPAAGCDVQLWLGKEAKGEPLAKVKTNDAGLAEFRVTPKAEQFRVDHNGEQRNVEMLGGQVIQAWGPRVLLDIHAEARDRKGNTAKATAEVNSHPLGENVLLRLDKAIYQGGDAINVDVLTSAGTPTAYVDVIRGGQTLLSRWLEVKDGKAADKVALPETAFGTLEVHAYQMLRTGEIIRDSRVVYVQPRTDLKIKIDAAKNVHTPGEEGRIRFEVTDAQGRPTAAALGVIIVDEAVYALQEMQPGLEKVYFTLQEELLKPQVQIKYHPSDTIDNLVRQPVLPAPKQQVAEVLLTAVRPKLPARWEVAPEVERRNRYETQVQQIGWGLYQFAWNSDRFMKQDDAGKWHFTPDVLQELVKTGHLNPQALEAPFGGKLTLADLKRGEKGFSLKDLTGAITHHRLKSLAEAFVRYTDANKAKFLKDGKWTFPPVVLADAARNGGLADQVLQDAWGQAFKLVESRRKLANKTGHSQFDHYDIVSAGPDRDYESTDDIHWTAVHKETVGGWWKAGQQPQAQLAMQRHDPRQWRNRVGEGRGGLGGRFDEREMLLGQQLDRAGGRPFNAPGAPPMPARDMAKQAVAGEKADAKGRLNEGPGGTGGGDAGGAPAPKLREYFPETMLWQPSLITDDKGVAHMAVNFADSITTWRLSASASSRGGALGGTNVPLKVFQDFFVDIDLPVALTQSDEVAFPVAVYNYLKTPQTVKIELKSEPWFTLLDTQGLTRTLKLQPNEVTAVKFRIKANRIGAQPLTVTALGSKMSDMVKRIIDVVPNGQKVEKVVNDRLTGKVVQTLDIPQDAVPDASKLIVRIYPGVVAQVLEGVEGMIRLPGG